MVKDVDGLPALDRAIRRLVASSGRVFVETDMRADRNPRRMRAIPQAAIDLVRRSHSGCPLCRWSGYGMTARLTGLPCAACGEPTSSIRAV